MCKMGRKASGSCAVTKFQGGMICRQISRYDFDKLVIRLFALGAVASSASWNKVAPVVAAAITLWGNVVRMKRPVTFAIVTAPTVMVEGSALVVCKPFLWNAIVAFPKVAHRLH